MENLKKHPFAFKDLEIFYSRGVGIFGESIYPIVWEGPFLETDYIYQAF